MVKFSSKLSEEAVAGLRDYAAERDRPLAHVLDQAVREFLSRARMRPAFRDAVEATLEEHEPLLRRLS